MKEFYQRLGVAESASQDDIKQAYRRLAKEKHPDKPDGNAEEFKKLGEAYDTLKDPQLRRDYDNPPQQRFNFRSANFTDHHATQFEDIFNIFSQRQQIKRYHLTISILDSINGKTVTLNGVNYTLPAGVVSGDTFAITNNEQVVIEVLSDTKYKIQGWTIHTTHTVPILDCILGTQINVKTVCGSTLNITLPQGSDHTTILRVNGYGMMNRNTGKRQEMLVHIIPTVPKQLTKSQKELYEQLRDMK